MSRIKVNRIVSNNEKAGQYRPSRSIIKTYPLELAINSWQIILFAFSVLLESVAPASKNILLTLISKVSLSRWLFAFIHSKQKSISGFLSLAKSRLCHGWDFKASKFDILFMTHDTIFFKYYKEPIFLNKNYLT